MVSINAGELCLDLLILRLCPPEGLLWTPLHPLRLYLLAERFGDHSTD